MDIVRIQTAEQLTESGFLDKIRPHLTFQDNSLRDPYVRELVAKLLHLPESVLVIVGFDDDDPSNGLKAFIIAYNPGVSIPYVQLTQVWSHAGNPFDWYKPFLARLLVWANASGKGYIRAETLRDTDALYRRFGFSPFAQIVSMDVNQGLFNLLNKENPEEFHQWVTSSVQTYSRLPQ